MIYSLDWILSEIVYIELIDRKINKMMNGIEKRIHWVVDSQLVTSKKDCIECMGVLSVICGLDMSAE